MALRARVVNCGSIHVHRSTRGSIGPHRSSEDVQGRELAKVALDLEQVQGLIADDQHIDLVEHTVVLLEQVERRHNSYGSVSGSACTMKSSAARSCSYGESPRTWMRSCRIVTRPASPSRERPGRPRASTTCGPASFQVRAAQTLGEADARSSRRMRWARLARTWRLPIR